MGYRVDTSVTLVLERMDGAEVTVLIGVPLAALREWDTCPTIVEEWAVFLKWAKPTWNLEDAEGPIPVAEESLERLPVPVIRDILRGWRHAAVNPPAPLPPQSSGGEP